VAGKKGGQTGRFNETNSRFWQLCKWAQEKDRLVQDVARCLVGIRFVKSYILKKVKRTA